MKPVATQFVKYLKPDDVCYVNIGASMSRYTRYPIQIDVIVNRKAFPNCGVLGGFSARQFVGYARSALAAQARAASLVRGIKKRMPIEIEIKQSVVSKPG